MSIATDLVLRILEARRKAAEARLPLHLWPNVVRLPSFEAAELREHCAVNDLDVPFGATMYGTTILEDPTVTEITIRYEAPPV